MSTANTTVHSMPTPAPNRLRQLRSDHNLRLVDVAALVGKDQSVVRRYETGKTDVPLDVLRRLAGRYEVTVEHLLGWDRQEAA